MLEFTSELPVYNTFDSTLYGATLLQLLQGGKSLSRGYDYRMDSSEEKLKVFTPD